MDYLDEDWFLCGIFGYDEQKVGQYHNRLKQRLLFPQQIEQVNIAFIKLIDEFPRFFLIFSQFAKDILILKLKLPEPFHKEKLLNLGIRLFYKPLHNLNNLSYTFKIGMP